MSEITIGINPTTEGTGTHDPSAVLFEDGKIVYGIEEERLNRRKHSYRTFPSRSIQSCLEYYDLELPDVDQILISWNPKEMAKYDMRLAFKQPNFKRAGYHLVESFKNYNISLATIRNQLSDIGTPVPPITTYNHHRCHAASAFYPSGFEEALVVTLDGRGESDSTVIWKGGHHGLERIRTYSYPNSLGAYYGAITEFLGYVKNNDEGKVMGLAPYGGPNEEIENQLRDSIQIGVDYDVDLGYHGKQALQRLESIFDREQKRDRGNFSDWDKDFAFVAQQSLENIAANVVESHCQDLGLSNVCLAGGVALNCKMNKKIMELDVVDEIFVQPVANDAGTALGAGMIGNGLQERNQNATAYLGPEYSNDEIKDVLNEFKLEYHEPDNLETWTAKEIADGKLVGWFQGRLEMGPRALGNRSILADSRTIESLDRVNEFVKHREEWRPFAPSMLEEFIDDYLVEAEPGPFMVKTFDVKDEKKEEIPAVLHPADATTRPQTVNRDQNPRYYELIRAFYEITDVPVILNTSFNDSGEPIVNKPSEAIKDFFGMGLDILVLEDIVLEK